MTSSSLLAVTQRPRAALGSYAMTFAWLGAFISIGFQLAAIGGEIFYSGDEGIKLLLAKQFAAGEVWSQRLELDAPPQVVAAWKQGLYPFEPPFVYRYADGWQVSFPSGFEFLAARLYRWFGYRGLYVLPIAGVASTLLITQHTLRTLEAPRRIQFLAFASLALLSPLPLFGAVFWEHSCAVALAMLGMNYLTLRRDAQVSALLPFCAGMGSSLAAAFRSEHLLFSAICLLFVFLRRQRHPHSGAFTVGIALGTFAVLCANSLLTQSLLGVHALQVTDRGFSMDRWIAIGSIALDLWRQILVFLPSVSFCVALLVVLVTADRHLRALGELKTLGVLCVCVLFSILVPLILPNSGGKQIPPRYALILAPATALVAAELSGLLLKRQLGRRVVRVLCACAALSALLGGVTNTWRAARRVRSDHLTTTLPAVEFLRDKPARLLVVTQTYLAQGLASLFESKAVLRASTPADMGTCLSVAASLGQTRLLIVSYVGDGGFERLGVTLPVVEHTTRGMFEIYEVAVPSSADS